jgi:hypothetical protein
MKAHWLPEPDTFQGQSLAHVLLEPVRMCELTFRGRRFPGPVSL